MDKIKIYRLTAHGWYPKYEKEMKEWICCQGIRAIRILDPKMERTIRQVNLVGQPGNKTVLEIRLEKPAAVKYIIKDSFTKLRICARART